MVTATYCDRCELDFGSKREDGSVVVRSTDKYYGEYCEPCAVICENADEAAWIQHENDKFFGGGQ